MGLLRKDPAFNRHVTVELALDERAAVTHDTLIPAISTLHRLAFGMRPFGLQVPARSASPCSSRAVAGLLRTFLSIVRGRPSRNAVPESGYFSHNADAIRLCLEGKLNLDGEILVADGQIDIRASKPWTFSPCER